VVTSGVTIWSIREQDGSGLPEGDFRIGFGCDRYLGSGLGDRRCLDQTNSERM
jgi:hypothetical protein